MSPRDELQLQRERAARLDGCDDLLAVLDTWIADAEKAVEITTSDDARREFTRRAALLYKIRAEMVQARDRPRP